MSDQQRLISTQPVMILPTPWTSINDLYLDGSVPHELPIRDHIHPLMKDYATASNDISSQPYYKKIALDLVAETVFHYPYPYISEKTIRPIMNQRMFIIAGPPGMLNLLKEKGFETWSDLLDESYDQIIDPCDRLNALLRSIHNFINLDIKSIKEYLRKNADKLKHNLEHLHSLRQQEIKDLIRTMGKN